MERCFVLTGFTVFCFFLYTVSVVVGSLQFQLTTKNVTRKKFAGVPCDDKNRPRQEIAVVKKEIALSAAYTPAMASRSLPEQPVSFLTCFAGNHLSAS